MNTILRILRTLCALGVIAVTASVPAIQGCGGGGKDCDKGKPCGDTCIAENETCHK